MPSQPSIKIQNALYVSNLEGDFRLQACLAAHASLMDRENVPRHYIKLNDDMTRRKWSNVITSCLRTNSREIYQATVTLVRGLGITKDCREVTHTEKLASLSAIEDIILDGWGVGKIHYEMARFTPFTSEDIGLLLDPKQTPWSAEICFLFKRLKLRAEHQERFCAENSEIDHENSHCTYAQVYRQKLELDWQNFWLSNANYIDDSEDRLISAITILKKSS